jgi:hypothetical protein
VLFRSVQGWRGIISRRGAEGRRGDAEGILGCSLISSVYF